MRLHCAHFIPIRLIIVDWFILLNFNGYYDGYLSNIFLLLMKELKKCFVFV